jgi:hypothetical protein
MGEESRKLRSDVAYCMYMYYLQSGRIFRIGSKRFGKIVFEKLSIDKMVKNHNLAQSILDSTWYRIRQLAACKAEVIIVDYMNDNFSLEYQSPLIEFILDLVNCLPATILIKMMKSVNKWNAFTFC